MHYVFQVLAAVLMGISIGAIVHNPNNAVIRVGALIAIVLALVTAFTVYWPALVIGVVVFVVVQAMQHGNKANFH